MQHAYVGDQRADFARRGIEFVPGTAHFVAPDVIAVDDSDGGAEVAGRSWRPDAVVIATGSEPVMPTVAGIELADTSTDALGYAERPSSLAILGGGYIAMEFAGIYASFGTKVTILARGDRLLSRFDREAVDVVRVGLEGLGVEFRFDASLERVEAGGGGLRLSLRARDGGTSQLTAERLLTATGRRPALAGLGLENAGVRLVGGRPVVDESLRTSDPHIWVAGDAAGGIELTPVAALEGGSVARSLLAGRELPIDLRAMPTTCFAVPELAQVGLTEEAARAAHAPGHVTVARGDFEYVAQAIISEQTAGLVKVVAGPGGQILGAVVAGPHAAELIYPFALAVRAGVSVDQLRATHAIHPSLSEALNNTASAEPQVVELAA